MKEDFAMKNKYKINMCVILLILLILNGCQTTNAKNITSQTPVQATVNIVSGNNSNNEINTNSKEEMLVSFIDVGQGDSIYIKTPKGDDILIDGGDNEAGTTVVNYLKQMNVDDIEILINTHPDADHSGGLDEVMQHFKVESVYMPRVSHTTRTFEDLLLAIKKQELKIKEAKAGVKLPLTDIEAEFISPSKDYGNDLNAWSAVLKVNYGDTAFLFTGDAETITETYILASSYDIRADVLKLGHHGSNTSTSEEFLKAVNPSIGIISVGKENKYGHPHEETLHKLNQYNVQVLRTDELGTITLLSDGRNIIFDKVSIQGKSKKADNKPITIKNEYHPNESVTQTAQNSQVIISNVDLVKEVVTITNQSGKDIDLSGWKIVSVTGNQEYYFPHGFIIKANQSITVASGDAEGTLKWGKSNIWNNSGDPAELYDEKGELVSTFN